MNNSAQKPRITVVDYGMGNIFSVVKALEKFGADVELTADPDKLSEAHALVLPGDGAFGAAMKNLEQREILQIIKRHAEDDKWLFGICVGFQLFFEESEEFGVHKGFGFFPGKIKKFSGDFTIPHMGWNEVRIHKSGHPLLKGLSDKSFFYFIHSYYASCSDDRYLLGSCNYHLDFTAMVGYRKIFGTQFHPEKSHEDGLRIIENFCNLIAQESQDENLG